MATIGAVVDTTALLLENRAVTGVNLRTAAREVDAQRTLTRQNQCGEPRDAALLTHGKEYWIQKDEPCKTRRLPT